MRTAILTVFVVSLALVHGQGFGFGGFSPVQQENWGGVSNKVSGHLVQLASEQGHHFKLVKLRSVKSQVVAGINYEADAEFENKAGEKLDCSLSLWVQQWVNYDKLTLKCAEKEYVVERGTQAT